MQDLPSQTVQVQLALIDWTSGGGVAAAAALEAAGAKVLSLHWRSDLQAILPGFRGSSDGALGVGSSERSRGGYPCRQQFRGSSRGDRGRKAVPKNKSDDATTRPHFLLNRSDRDATVQLRRAAGHARTWQGVAPAEHSGGAGEMGHELQADNPA